jgi:hypothetical protein
MPARQGRRHFADAELLVRQGSAFGRQPEPNPFAIQSLQRRTSLGALLKKLGACFKSRSQLDRSGFFALGHGRVTTRKFERLKTAILEKRVLEILYCTLGETAKRSILRSTDL